VVLYDRNYSIQSQNRSGFNLFWCLHPLIEFYYSKISGILTINTSSFLNRTSYTTQLSIILNDFMLIAYQLRASNYEYMGTSSQTIYRRPIKRSYISAFRAIRVKFTDWVVQRGIQRVPTKAQITVDRSYKCT